MAGVAMAAAMGGWGVIEVPKELAMQGQAGMECHLGSCFDTRPGRGRENKQQHV